MATIQYPFIPKSTAYMQEGQFWDIPLSNGQFACGRVVQFNLRNGRRDSRLFLAGLLDWCGDEPPTATTIARCQILEQGGAHIRTIEWNHGAIRGWRSLDADGIEPLFKLSQMVMNKDCMLQRGFEVLRPATLHEQKTLYVHSVWGHAVIQGLAEAYFVRKQPPKRKLPWQEYNELLEFIEKSGQTP